MGAALDRAIDAFRGIRSAERRLMQKQTELQQLLSVLNGDELAEYVRQTQEEAASCDVCDKVHH